MMKSGVVGCALGALMMSALPASAQTTRADEGWRFALSPYVWFTGISGETTIPRGTENFNADFGDLFDNLKFTVSGFFEARNGNFSIVADLMYFNMQQGIPVPGFGDYSGGSSRLRTTEASLIGLFTVAEHPSYRLEVGGGIRGWWMNNEIRLDPGRLPGRSASSSTNWLDPIVATRATWRFNDRLSTTLYGDIGGFDTGSRLTWQALATLDWRITDSLSASLGYRWMYIDYARGDLQVDLNMTGPIIGGTLRF